MTAPAQQSSPFQTQPLAASPGQGPNVTMLDRMKAFYAQKAPDKVDKAEALLNKYQVSKALPMQTDGAGEYGGPQGGV